MKISNQILLLTSIASAERKKRQVEVQISRTDRLRELFRSLFGAPKHENIISDNFDENYCEDRCVIHPSNRFTCGKARSADQCQIVGCCWDDNAQHCYKEAWDHCPRDRCENINPVDRATCSGFSGLKGVGKQKCETAGCCFDSYASECYDSSPKSRDPYPNTGECQVESEERESCGFGLSESDCAEMTGCCWHVSDESNIYCFKSVFSIIENQISNSTNHIDEKDFKSSDFEIDNSPSPRSEIISLDLEPMRSQSSVDIIEESGAPKINLKIANRGKEIEEIEQSKATKIHLWINFISQLTRRIEVACESKIEPMTCMNEAFENVLIPTCDELLFKTYGLSHVSTETDAIELLEAINDVLTWFCFDQPEARFCRTVVLSGFTLNILDQSEPVIEANKRFDAMVSLGKNGMLGSYQHDSKHSKMDITECSNTYLLIQTYAPSRDEIVQVDEDLSESCVARGACWKSMSFRDVIFNLYGDYDADTRKAFLELWKAVGPLLVPGTEPILSNSVCIEPISQSFSKAKDLFDGRFNTESRVSIEKSGSQ